MKTRSFLALAGIVGMLFGAGFLFATEPMLALYGATSPLDPGVALNARYFGTALLAWGVINWLVRSSHDRDAIRSVLLGNVLGDVLGLLVTFQGLLAGSLNAFSWSTVLVYALLAAGSLYFVVSDGKQVAHG
jgi:hypothetical protein